MSLKIHTTAGIDVGTSFVKVAILRSQAGNDARLLGTAAHRIRRRDLREVVDSAFAEACAAAQLEAPTLDYVATTGEADAVEFRTGHFYSMTTHGRGALFLMPEARAVLDVGALHARAMRIDERGKTLAYRMTSQCASGSGQFLENIARYLGVALQDVGQLSSQASRPEEVSSICAVLAETDVINMVSRGIETPDILRGIHLSIGGRLVGLVRALSTEGVLAVTGGLAHDVGLLEAIKDRLSKDVRSRGRNVTLQTSEHSILAGAIGAALLGAHRHQQLATRALQSDGIAALASPGMA